MTPPFPFRRYRRPSLSEIAAGVATAARVWSVSDVAAAIAALAGGGGGGGALVYGSGGANTAASGTATMSLTTAVPGSALSLGCLIEVHTVMWGGAYFDEETYEFIATSGSVTISGTTIFDEHVTLSGAATETRWAGILTSDYYIAGITDGRGNAANVAISPEASFLDLGLTVTGQIYEGADGARGVLAPLIIVTPNGAAS